ncbi:MAG: glycosyltransferase [Bacteroidales bacterium]
MSIIEDLFRNFSLQSIWGIIFILYAAAWLILMIYHWLVFSRIALFKKQAPLKTEAELPPVSIVIAAKNEYHNLSRFLPLILQQNYPDFEVIIVNDASDDDSAELLDDLKQKNKHLKVINLYKNFNFFKGKKFPLSVGIRSAKHEHLLLTDADCKPYSNLWIKTMLSSYGKDTQIVLGYGKYEHKKTFLNKIQRYDTLFTAMQYFSFALLGDPYMGVGRNLSYVKTLFQKSKGFSSHYKIKSGDDDLFINKVAGKHNTAICAEQNGFTISRSTATFGHWVKQKRRHLTTGKYYKPRHKLMLGVFNISRFVFWATLIALLIRFFNAGYVITSGILLLGTFLFILKNIMRKFDEKHLLLLSPFLDIILLISYVFITFANLMRKPDKWK